MKLNIDQVRTTQVENNMALLLQVQALNYFGNPSNKQTTYQNPKLMLDIQRYFTNGE